MAFPCRYRQSAMAISQEIKEALVNALFNGRDCFVKEGQVVLVADEEAPEGESVYSPPSSTVSYQVMKDFINQVDDFEKQSALMSALAFDRPFKRFKDEVYKTKLVDPWKTFLMQEGLKWFDATYA